MGKSFFVRTSDADLQTASQLFADKITATPTAYGLVAADATAYNTVNTAYSDAYTAAKDPATRTKSLVIAKNQARKNLKAAASKVARKIQGDPTITDTQLNDLGLSVRATPTPKPAPDFAPEMDILNRSGTNVEIQLHHGSTKRGKPAGVAGASVFSHVGATPPVEISAWQFQGNSTKMKTTVAFDAALPAGTIVWLTAFFYNARGESGPGCSPVSAILAGGGMAMAA